jgi:prepilin peptidase CpaA
MFGAIKLFHYAVLFLALSSVITDLLKGKIYNIITLPFLLLGILYSAHLAGLQGVGQSLLGILAGFLLYGWMYAVRALGAGDVKLLMALGAWGGLRFAEETALLGILVGGVLGVILLALTGRLPGFIRRMYYFVLSLYVSELEFQPPKIDKTFKMPFGIPIAIAAVWIAFLHPFEKWGIYLWP